MAIELDPTTSALIVLDMQNDVVHPDGVWGGPSGAAAHCIAQNAVANIQALIAACRAAGVQVIHVHHRPSVFGPDDRDSKQNANLFRDTRASGGLSTEWGAAPMDGLAPDPAQDIVVYKQRANAFTSTNLDIKLRGLGVETIILTGAWTNMSVESTTRVGADIGYSVVIASDGTATLGDEWQKAALEYGVTAFAQIGTTAEIVAAIGG